MAEFARSRALGSIWGVCVGDALGGPVQFSEPNTFTPITTLRFVQPFHKPAGSYSDDGSMTLALAQSLIDSQGTYDHALSIEYFLDWLCNGRFSTTSAAWDVGFSTRAALHSWKSLGVADINQTQAHIDRALDRENRSGNGSLMRIAPVGVVLWQDAATAKMVARQHGRVTHPSLPCVEACDLYTELVCGAMRGDGKDQLCDMVRRFQPRHSKLAERMTRYKTLEGWRTRSESEMRSSGWVVDTLEVALWAFFKYDSWAEGALAVVNLGGDSDTAGAVFGGLAGAFYGYEAIPKEWVDGMQNQELIGAVAGKLADLVISQSEKMI
ncbi:hypothetical protein FE257_009225 [Aspergillus nanangensis]|uniref:ADP-ribosylhydrolase ARH3 n=1 Tax=Aspergillus nanangensis TaxID=2582783 RepID=A0AAD4CKJ5_ASPNN|nr:hypothetical protein FE257_009225 [Aspergillus nanangensis]